MPFLGNVESKTFGEDNQLKKITTNYKVDIEGSEVDDEIERSCIMDCSFFQKTLHTEEFIKGSDDKQVESCHQSR